MRDWNGLIVRVVRGPFSVCDSTKAKVVALVIGLWNLKELKVCWCLVEGDSLVL